MTGVEPSSALFVFVTDKLAVEWEFIQVFGSSPG
jgi:hypothetical protein